MTALIAGIADAHRRYVFMLDVCKGICYLAQSQSGKIGLAALLKSCCLLLESESVQLDVHVRHKGQNTSDYVMRHRAWVCVIVLHNNPFSQAMF